MNEYHINTNFTDMQDVIASKVEVADITSMDVVVNTENSSTLIRMIMPDINKEEALIEREMKREEKALEKEQEINNSINVDESPKTGSLEDAVEAMDN